MYDVRVQSKGFFAKFARSFQALTGASSNNWQNDAFIVPAPAFEFEMSLVQSSWIDPSKYALDYIIAMRNKQNPFSENYDRIVRVCHFHWSIYL